MIESPFFIAKSDFRIWMPEVDFSFGEDEEFFEKGDKDAYNSRRLRGIMSTPSRDRQGENVIAKGLDFNPFLHHGHFNDNHSQSTSAILGYPETVRYQEDIDTRKGKVDGWVTEGYVIKGTTRADQVWELAKALAKVPDRKLGFSIEGKVTRRKNKVIEKALIRNVAITNCPVNTDCTWDVLAKSFVDEEIAYKSLSAGYGAAGGPAAQSGGSALGSESLEKDDDKRSKKKTNALKMVVRSMGYDPEEIEKAFQWAIESRADLTDEAAAEVVKYLITNGR